MLQVDRRVGLARFATHDTVHMVVRTLLLREDGFRAYAMRAAAAITTAAIAALSDRGSGQASLRTKKRTNPTYMMKENVLPSSPVKSPFALAVPVDAEAPTVVATPSGNVNFWQHASHLRVSQMGWD